MFSDIKSILFGLIIAALLFIFIKFKGVRIFLGTALIVILVFTGITSAFRLDNYYNAQGGIVGQITGVYDKDNQTNISEELTKIDFELKNVSLTKNEKGKYSAEFSTEKTLTLNDNEFYQILVNNEPTQLVLSDKNSAVATYTYMFQSNELIDNNYKEITTDTMTISFGFYGNYSKVICEIDGEVDSASLWDSYFTKNNLTISIVKVNEIEISKSSELKTLTIYANDKVIEVVKIKKGSDYVLPSTLNITGYIFNYFEQDGKIVTKITNINQDTNIYANLTKSINVMISANFDNQDANSNIMGEYQTIEGITLKEFYNTIIQNEEFQSWLNLRGLTGYELVGFTTKEGFTNKPSDVESDYVINSDITLYSVWQVKAYPITIISNGSFYKVGELDKVKDFEFLSPYNYKVSLTFTSANVENYVFSHYKMYFTNFPKISKDFKDETVSFSIKDIFEKLHNNYDPSEYVPEGRTEFEDVGDLIIEIYTKEYERSWTEDYSEDDLTQISYFEKEIYKYFGISYSENGEETKYPIEELEFLYNFWQCVTKENTKYSIEEYREKIANLFNFEYKEDIGFVNYLKLLYIETLKY